MEAYYLGDIELTAETLEHYGVKGMKWGQRKTPIVVPGAERKRLDQLNPASSRSGNKPVSTTGAKKKTTTGATVTSNKSKSKKSKSAAKAKSKAQDILKNFKLTKSKGKSASTKKEKAATTKKAASTEKKAASTEKKSAATKSGSSSQEPKVVYKTQISDTYTKYLEKLLEGKQKTNMSTDEIRERLAKRKGQNSLKGNKWRKVW